MFVKVLVEYRNKDPNHVEWAKTLKELYVPGLRDFVKAHYPLGPVWSAAGKAIASAPPKAPTVSAPAPPPPPPASLFSSETPQSSSSRPKAGMAAVFQEISSGKPVTSGSPPSTRVCLFVSICELLLRRIFVVCFSLSPYYFLLCRFEKGHS